MANLLGESLIKASEVYKSQKNNYNSYEEFFAENCVSSFLSNEDESVELIKDFLHNGLNSIDESTTNDSIAIMLSNLKKKLLDRGCVSEDFNVLEFIGYLLLGQVLNTK